ncbi:MULTISPECIES: PDZ domain-containing protein [Flavobacterium]|uniref:PDZ domain-containing protein n=1 Tax=Flavobacterium TaxID=237 RepID=UPI001FCBA78C|nr:MULTISPECIES: PDZ domain-containing protein [Flavobacterium]UOK41275.1 PDZ domain-containing protein [Flavobacterium enshiense]
MRAIVFVFFLMLFKSVSGQNGFQFDSDKDMIVIPFTFVDNLIIMPVEINGTKLNMLLDSGSEPSIIFSFPENDTIQLYNTKKIKISGLGNEELAEGIFSDKNTANVSGYINKQFDLLVILDENLNFSSRIGIPVNGVLGYSFFKNNVIEIDYQKKKVTIYKDRKILEKSRVKSFTQLPINVVNDRAYLNVKAKLDGKEFDLKLLVDTGLGDGLWLFENGEIKSNSNYFEDVLGEGIGGTVFGKKSRLEELEFAKFKFKSPLVSYPDTASYKQLQLVTSRNGSLGGAMLKRFTMIMDYSGGQLYLKKSSYYDDAFNYNMSGIEVQHEGIEWVKEGMIRNSKPNNTLNVNDIVFDNSHLKYKFALKPVYTIASVRKDSPAEVAGLKIGDKILKINGKNVSNLSKQKIDNMLHEEDGKKIEMEIERKGVKKEMKFKLKKIL